MAALPLIVAKSNGDRDHRPLDPAAPPPRRSTDPQQQPKMGYRQRIAERLRERAQAAALRQYVRLLAGQADIEGVELGAASTPLVQ